MNHGRGFASLLLALLFTALLAVPALAQEGVVNAQLTNADCAKCHDKQPLEIAAKGAAHKTQIGCQDCHTGHRPKVENNIPACSMCHAGEKHFEIENCLGCHNPHQPLEVVLEGELKAPCLTCHESQGQELTEHPSKHETFACNFCHADQHGVIPACVDCHEPHSAQMAQGDCNVCHQAHQPLTLTYGADTPSTFCAACHDTAYAQLKASQAMHGGLDCVFCHQAKHKMVPKCTDCHGLPHPDTMHQKFPKCSECHATAHDLNNWPSQNNGGGKQGAK